MNRSFVVVVSGLPGTGKSTLATALAQRIGAAHLSRKGDHSSYLFRRSRNAPQGRSNQRLLSAVDRELAKGRAAIVDVVAEPDLRGRLDALVATHAVPAISVEVFCSDQAELQRRLAQRPRASQRTFARLAETYTPAAQALVVDSTGAPEVLADRVAAFVSSRTDRQPM